MRAAIRRGWSTMICCGGRSATEVAAFRRNCGTCVVFPEPVGAVRTRRFDVLNTSRISSRMRWMGRSTLGMERSGGERGFHERTALGAAVARGAEVVAAGEAAVSADQRAALVSAASPEDEPEQGEREGRNDEQRVGDIDLAAGD